MALAAKVTSLDAVPEAFRGEYKKSDDGSFYLDVNGVDDMPAVIGLKRSKQEILDEKKKVEDKLKAYGDDTPEKVAEYKKAAEGKEPKDVKELQQKLDQVTQNAQREIQAAKDEAATATKSAEDYFAESEVTKALNELKGSSELLGHVMREAIKVERVNGKMVAKVIKDGTARIKDAAGNPFTVLDLAAELKADPKYGRAFEPTGTTGSGAEATTITDVNGITTVRPGNDGIVRADPEAVLSGKTVVTQ